MQMALLRVVVWMDLAIQIAACPSASQRMIFGYEKSEVDSLAVPGTVEFQALMAWASRPLLRTHLVRTKLGGCLAQAAPGCSMIFVCCREGPFW